MDATYQNTLNGMITAEMGQSVVTGVLSNVSTVLPYIFAILAIGIVFAVVKKFMNKGK